MKPNEVFEKYQDKFVGRIEDMSGEEILEIFKDAQKAEMPEIKTLPYMAGGKLEEVIYEFPELTALCPMTALPDTYTVRIKYYPNESVPELKSLRFYFLAYRNLPIIHENLLAKIRDEFKAAVKPTYCDVELDVAIRGGIKTSLLALGFQEKPLKPHPGQPDWIEKGFPQKGG